MPGAEQGVAARTATLTARAPVREPVRMVGLRPVPLIGPGRAQRVLTEARTEIQRATLGLLGVAVLLGVLLAAALDVVDAVGLLHHQLLTAVPRDGIRAALWALAGAAAQRLDMAAVDLAWVVREARQVRRCPTCRSAAAALSSAGERWSDCVRARHAGRPGRGGAR